MKKGTLLYEDADHQCIMFSFDEEEENERFLSVNQYLIIHQGKGVLIDPGSQSVFYEMLEAVGEYIALDKIAFIFFSHQDPDVSGSIPLWAQATPAKLILSKLWVRFMSHYGLMDHSKIIALEDHGATIHFGADFFRFLPAHFLHSPGNFSLFDSRSRILFSGDIGAAVVELSHLYKEVEDFESHLPYLEGFHTRYMAGNRFAKAWVKNARDVCPSIIAPQHGALFKDALVEAFLAWFETLQCGGDILESLYSKET